MFEAEAITGELHQFLADVTRSGPGWPIRTYTGQITHQRGMTEAVQLSLFAQIVSCQNDITDRLKLRRLQTANTLQRTQIENVIRIAWLEQHEGNALWLLAGDELKAQKNSRLALKDIPYLSAKAIAVTKEAISNSEARVERYKKELQPNSPAFDETGNFKPMPDLCSQATAAGLLDFYRTYYAHGCNHSHSSAVFILGPYISPNPVRAEIHPAQSDSDIEYTWKNVVGLLWRTIELRRDIGWSVNTNRHHELHSKVTAVRPASNE